MAWIGLHFTLLLQANCLCMYKQYVLQGDGHMYIKQCHGTCLSFDTCQVFFKCAEENISAEIKRMSLVCSIMRLSLFLNNEALTNTLIPLLLTLSFSRHSTQKDFRTTWQVCVFAHIGHGNRLLGQGTVQPRA